MTIIPESDSIESLVPLGDTIGPGANRSPEKRSAPNSEQLPVKKTKTKELSKSLIMKYIGLGEDVIKKAPKTEAMESESILQYVDKLNENLKTILPSASDDMLHLASAAVAFFIALEQTT